MADLVERFMQNGNLFAERAEIRIFQFLMDTIFYEFFKENLSHSRWNDSICVVSIKADYVCYLIITKH